MAAPPSLTLFPEDIIRVILRFVSPEDNLSTVQLLSHRFKELADEALLWRYHCYSSWRYWDPSHRFSEKLLLRASSVDWKALWLQRRRTQHEVGTLLDGILATRVGQVSRFKQICLKGYDAKDFLLEQRRGRTGTDDNLARRYHADAALQSIHRGMAIEAWMVYHRSPPSMRGLDRALGAFDMFVLHDQPQDLDYICTTLDELARAFLDEHSPWFEDMSTRQKALALVSWLRAKDLTGMEHPEENYRNLRNCLIGHALSEPEHSSLPIISSAIFCCVAERLNLTSYCCAFPTHVHVAVLAAPGENLDGDEGAEPDAQLKAMYLDPYGSSQEVTRAALQRTLLDFGVQTDIDVFLRPSPTSLIVQRTAHNIRATCSASQGLIDEDRSDDELMRLRAGSKDVNLKSAVYAAMWAELLVQQPGNGAWNARFDAVVKELALSWRTDSWLAEKYLVPLSERYLGTQPPPWQPGPEGGVRETLALIYEIDSREPVAKPRSSPIVNGRVLFTIGQVFRHNRYNFIGIINGWAITGLLGLPTPHYLNAADDAEEQDAGLQARVFYTCVKVGIDRLRVSQDNIELVTDPSVIPESLFHRAGQFFKRFDAKTCTFVSNMKDAYPDD